MVINGLKEHKRTYRQLEFLAQGNAAGSGSGPPVGGGPGVGRGAL